MGFFVTINGDFSCVRCGSVSERSIQTKLLRTEAENSCCPYRVGDGEILDGLDDYFNLLPWRETEPLVVLVGDWSCADCGLNWQWARVVFDVDQNSATITELSGFHPTDSKDFAGVHYVEPDLAELSGAIDRWETLSIQSRSDLMATGFRRWCIEVAGVEPQS